MKLNKNGWGTLEMFLLSGGLLIALLVAVYFIGVLYGNLDNATNKRQYIDLENKLENAAKEYVTVNRIDVYDNQVINYDTLYNTGYIDNLVDNKGNNCTGYVRINIIDFINHYYAYISCKNYKSNNY